MRWPLRRFGDIAEFRNGLNFASGARGGDLPVVGVGDFDTPRLRGSTGLETVKRPVDLAPDALLTSGDLLFVRSNGNPALVGRSMLVDHVDGPITHSGFTIRARVTSPAVHPRWVYAFFQSGLAKRALGLGASGTNISNLSQSILAAVELPVPAMDVQLRSLELIERTEESLSKADALIAAKREMKRGLMSELLTGRRRFPEFARTGAWREAALGQLLSVVSRPVTWDDAATYRLVSIRRRNGGLFLRDALLGREIKTKALFTVAAGDFLISRMQAVHGALAEVPAEFDGHHVSGMYLVLRPTSPSRVRTDFLHYASHLRRMYRNILTSCHGVHIEKMTFDPNRFLRTTVMIPPTLREQEKIARLLQEVDREIALLEKSRDLMDAERGAVMQGLLTGKLVIPSHPVSRPQLAHA